MPETTATPRHGATPRLADLEAMLEGDVRCRLCERPATHLLTHGDCSQRLCPDHAGATALLLLDPRPANCTACKVRGIPVAAVTLRAA